MFTHVRTHLLALAAVLVTAACAAPAANADLNVWANPFGLSGSNGADWVRVFERGPGTTYFAGTEDDGIYRSIDNGLQWGPDSTGLSAEGMHVRAILTTNGKTYAGTQAGLYLLNGTTWQPLAQGAGAGKLPFSVQALESTSPGSLVAGTFAGGVYRSADGGNTWSPPAPGNGMTPGETVWSLSKIGALVFAASSHGIYRSADAGATWTLASDGIPPSDTTLRVIQDKTNPNILYAATGGDGVYRTTNFGLTWSSISAGLGNGAVRGLEQVAGASTTRLYAATGDGLWAGTTGNGPVPGPVTWRKVSQTGLGNNTIFWAIDTFTLPNLIFAGTQSNGAYAMTLVPPANVQAPSITQSSLVVGRTATAAPGAWGGTGSMAYVFAWQRCSSQNTASCNDIEGANDDTYTYTDADLGAYVRVRVTATNAFPDFVPHVAYSVLSSKVGPNPLSLPGANQLSAPSISMVAPGNLSLPAVGDHLLASPGAINPKPAGTVVSYQWLRCDENGDACDEIPGATAGTYAIQTADAGLRVAVRESVSSVAGAIVAPQSGATNLVIPDPAANVTAPTIVGTAAIGTTLVGTAGTWKSPKTTFERQWLQCDGAGNACNPIIGATGPGYVVRALDAGHRLRLRVTADVNESYKLPPAVVAVTAPSALVPSPGSGPGTGTPPPKPKPKDTTPPTVSHLKLVSSKKGRTKVAFTSSEGGRATVTLKPRKGHGTRTQRGAARAGANTVLLARKVGGKTVRKGRYRLTVTVRDAAGNTSAPAACRSPAGSAVARERVG